jgi:hypothetical protein
VTGSAGLGADARALLWCEAPAASLVHLPRFFCEDAPNVGRFHRWQ